MKKKIRMFIIITIFCACLINFVGCKKKNEITITLYPNNGTEAKVIKTYADEKVELPEIPTAEGYFFGGWFLDKAFKQKVLFPAKFKKDTVLYGAWGTLVKYELDETTDTYQVTGVIFSHYNITVLEKYHGKKVTTIKAEAFKDNETIMNIKLPNTITTIEDRAFMNMSKLMNINLPDDIQTIGEDVFDNCNMLYYEDLKGLKYLDNWLVSAKDARPDMVQIKDTTVGILAGAFKGNQNIKEITIPSSVTRIEANTFAESSITVLNLHENVTYLDPTALNGTSQLTAINVSENNPIYESLKGVLYSKGLKELIKYPSNRTNKVVTLPYVVEKIHDGAFAGCENLETLNILDLVKSIGNNAFVYCKKLKTIELPEQLQEIGTEAFSGCTSLNKLVLPVNCKVGKNIIKNCEALESLTLPTIKNNGVVYDSSHLFGDTINNIKELTILGGNNIPAKFFSGYASLVTLKLPKTIENIDTTVFGELTKLEVLEFEDNDFYKVVNNTLYSADEKKLIYYLAGGYTQYYIVPSTVEEISSNAFTNSTYIAVIEISESVKIVRSHAFNNLPNLTNIIFKGNLDIVEEDICMNTPYVCMYFKDTMPNSNWCEGFNTHNYATKFNESLPQFIYTTNVNVKAKIKEELTIKYFVYGLTDEMVEIKVFEGLTEETREDVTSKFTINVQNESIILSGETAGKYELIIQIKDNQNIKLTIYVKLTDEQN